MMMTQLWLVPVDESSYQATLNQEADLSGDSNRPAEVPATARVWGFRTDQAQGDWERNRRNRDKAAEGDPLLFYRNSLSRYAAVGRLGPMWHTEYVRNELWNGGPAVDIFTVEDFKEVDIEREMVNRMLDYKESFWPQGLWRVADDRPVNELVDRIDEL